MTTGRLAMVVAIGALLAASCATAQPDSDSPDTAGSTDTPSSTSLSATTTSTTTPESSTGQTPSATTTEAPSVESTVEPKDSTTSTTSGSSSQIDPLVAPLVTIAIADLASHLGISEAEIDASSAAPVVWPDGGLGCPTPGMSYTQVQVDGYLIELSAGGQTYSYHGGGGRGPFLCLTSSK